MTDKKRRTITTIAIGDHYLRCGLACMMSCRDVERDDYRHVVFHAHADPIRFHIPDWVELVDVNDEVFSVVTPEELAYNGKLARQFKYIPFVHESCIEDSILFLDCDVIVYEDRFPELFEIIESRSALVNGRWQNDSPVYQDKSHNFALDLVSEGERLGLSLTNLALNSGVIGRAADEIGHEFGRTMKELLIEKPLTPYPNDRYFNDEAYVSVAFQLSVKGSEAGEIKLPTRCYCSTYIDGILKDEASGWPDIHIPSLQRLVTKPSLIHFIGHRRYPYYLNVVEEKVPYCENDLSSSEIS